MKRLVFHLYVSDDFEKNPFTYCHELCLKEYIGSFDNAIFSVAVDDLYDEEKIKAGIGFVKKICNGKIPYDVFVIKNDYELREVCTFQQIVLPLIEIGADDYIFFCHNKGTTASYYGRNIESVMLWNLFMYFYCLDNDKEMIDCFNDGKALYGQNLCEFKKRFDKDNSSVNPYELKSQSELIYAGAFYWMNTKIIKNIFESSNADLFGSVYGRYFAEDFSRYFLEEQLGSCNNFIYRSPENFNMYYMGYDSWRVYIDIFDKDAKCVNFIDKIMFQIKKKYNI